MKIETIINYFRHDMIPLNDDKPLNHRKFLFAERHIQLAVDAPFITQLSASRKPTTC